MPLTACASRRSRQRRDDGVASVELLGMLPILLVIALVIWQGYLAFAASSAANRAARDASRELAAGPVSLVRVEQVVASALPDWLEGGARVEVGPNPGCDDDTASIGSHVVVCVQVPLLSPTFTGAWEVRGSAVLPGAGVQP